MIKKFQAPKGPISKIQGKSIVLIGDDIDTDRIIPLGLKCVNFDDLGKSVFEDDRENLKGNILLIWNRVKDLQYLLSIVILDAALVEHAPQALLRLGNKSDNWRKFCRNFL